MSAVRDRAERLVRDGDVEPLGGRVYKVGPGLTPHVVTADGWDSVCSCPRQFPDAPWCVHVLAVQILQEQVALAGVVADALPRLPDVDIPIVSSQLALLVGVALIAAGLLLSAVAGGYLATGGLVLAVWAAW